MHATKNASVPCTHTLLAISDWFQITETSTGMLFIPRWTSEPGYFIANIHHYDSVSMSCDIHWFSHVFPYQFVICIKFVFNVITHMILL